MAHHECLLYVCRGAGCVGVYVCRGVDIYVCRCVCVCGGVWGGGGCVGWVCGVVGCKYVGMCVGARVGCRGCMYECMYWLKIVWQMRAGAVNAQLKNSRCPSDCHCFGLVLLFTIFHAFAFLPLVFQSFSIFACN